MYFYVFLSFSFISIYASLFLVSMDYPWEIRHGQSENPPCIHDVSLFPLKPPFRSGIQQHPLVAAVHALHQTATLGGLSHAGRVAVSQLFTLPEAAPQMRVKNNGCSLETCENSNFLVQRIVMDFIKPKHHRSPPLSFIVITISKF